LALCSRYFIFDQDGRMRRIPNRVYDAFYDGERRLVEHKGQTLRVLCVFIEFEGGRPKRTVGARGHYVKVDPDGRMDRKHADRREALLVAAMERCLFDVSDEKVTSLIPHIHRRDNTWKPSRAEINQVIRHIWPNSSR
jgi:hypothetical protein